MQRGHRAPGQSPYSRGAVGPGRRQQIPRITHWLSSVLLRGAISLGRRQTGQTPSDSARAHRTGATTCERKNQAQAWNKGERDWRPRKLEFVARIALAASSDIGGVLSSWYGEGRSDWEVPRVSQSVWQEWMTERTQRSRGRACRCVDVRLTCRAHRSARLRGCWAEREVFSWWAKSRFWSPSKPSSLFLLCYIFCFSFSLSLKFKIQTSILLCGKSSSI
jgi:hypothetical protein